MKLPTSPIHVTSQATVQSNSSVNVNAISLKNPLGGPMEILKIKFLLKMDTTALALSGSAQAMAGGSIGVKFDLGAIQICKDFVPVWNFGKSINLQVESQRNAGFAVFRYDWDLPKPLYIPDGALLTPTIQHRGQYPLPIDVRISYSGRSVAGPPKKLYVPYAMSYVSKVFDVAVADTDQSTETDLVNKFDQPIFLQRMSGRQLVFRNVLNDARETFAPFAILSSRFMRIQIVDSNGQQIVRNFTPIRSVFAACTRSWEMDGAMMLPQSYYIARLQQTAAPTPVDPMSTQVSLGLVGWRELKGETL